MSVQPIPASSILTVVLRESRVAVGVDDESVREYRIECKLGQDQWHVWRRYSQFSALRAALLQKGGCVATERAVLQPLPSSLLGFFQKQAVSEELAAARIPGLNAWLQSVVALRAAASSPSLLAFLGVALVERRARASIHVRAICSVGLAAEALRRDSSGVDILPETGDLLLFRTRGRMVPAAQRAVTGSDWDHVGLLIYRDARGLVCRAAECKAPGGVAGVVECDASGTQFYPLRACALPHVARAPERPHPPARVGTATGALRPAHSSCAHSCPLTRARNVCAVSSRRAGVAQVV